MDNLQVNSSILAGKITKQITSEFLLDDLFFAGQNYMFDWSNLPFSRSISRRFLLVFLDVHPTSPWFIIRV